LRTLQNLEQRKSTQAEVHPVPGHVHPVHSVQGRGDGERGQPAMIHFRAQAGKFVAGQYPGNQTLGVFRKISARKQSVMRNEKEDDYS
jgi:hypothetical protein